MLYYTGLLLLVIAVSIDGLGVGISYGIQKIRVPLLALAIIMICSGTTVFTAMTIGSGLKHFISPNISEKFGAFILIFLGCFNLYHLFRAKRREMQSSSNTTDSTVLGDVKKVIISPQQADLDRSGTISKHEAILLGMALALDAFGAGFAASLLHYSPLITAGLVTFMSGGFLLLGLKIGLLLSKKKNNKIISFFPSLLLIFIGLFNLIS